MHCQEVSEFYLHTRTFIDELDEPYLPLPSQPKLVLIYRPWGDGKLSYVGITTVSEQSAQDHYVMVSQLLGVQTPTPHCTT